MEQLLILKKQYVENLQVVNVRLEKLKQQEEELKKQKEQLTGAIFALDTLSSQMVSSNNDSEKHEPRSQLQEN
jgi:hypothetical protein